MKRIKNTKGITLVALIITIIVLLILAIVSIRLVMNGGIIDRAERGTQAYSDAEVKEQIRLAYTEYQAAQFTSDAGDANTFIKNRLKSAFNLQDNEIDVDVENGVVTVTMNGKDYTYDSKAGSITSAPALAKAEPGVTVPEGANAVYKSDGKKAVIPSGYTISNVTTEQSIDTGLVIKKDGNEWVWIPVSNSDLALMYSEDNTGWIMYGTGGETGIDAVVTKYKANARTDINSTLTRANPGIIESSSFKEPDTVVGNGTEYDKVQENWSAAGFTSYENMAKGLRDDYKNMIDSVKKYGGFYIGRYELSNAGTKKNQYPVHSKSWYELYKKCTELGSDSTISRMIWGCQWDQVCKFISTAKDANGKTISLTSSTKYGNYYNSVAPANTGNYMAYGASQNTGSNDAWKTNNIYDFAGNFWEWTQEAFNTGERARRGGSFYDNSSVITRYGFEGYSYPTKIGSNFSSRPVLYIK